MAGFRDILELCGVWLPSVTGGVVAHDGRPALLIGGHNQPAQLVGGHNGAARLKGGDNLPAELIGFHSQN